MTVAIFSPLPSSPWPPCSPKHHARLAALEARCWDLCDVIREHYYHPEFHGSFSLKKVLPVLVTSMSYAELTVHDGQEAERTYVEALRTDNAKRRNEIHTALLEYCRQDTVAMVRLREALMKRAPAVGHTVSAKGGQCLHF